MTRKTYFSEGSSWFKFKNLGLSLGKELSVAKELKLKVRKFWWLNLTFVDVTWEKLVGCFPPIRKRVKVKGAQEARVNQFLFQYVQNNEIFDISKMFKNNCLINVYYTKRKHLFIGLVVLFYCTLFR